MNIEQLRARLAQIEDEHRSIHIDAGANALDETQQSRWDELDTEAEGLRSEIQKAEESEARAKRVEESRAKWGSVQVGVKPGSPFVGLEDVRSESDMRARAVTALSETRYAGIHVSDEARSAAIDKIERIDGAAQYALVHAAPEYASAFRSYITSGGQAVFTQAEAEAVRASLSLTSANGGYAVPTFLDPTLIKTGAVTKNPIRAISSVKTGTTPVWNGVTVGNVTTAWKGEGSAFTDGSPTLGPVSVTAHDLTAYVTGSYEIFQDSSLFNDLPDLIGEAVDMAEGVAFISGSGSGAPYGVITAVSGTAGSLVTATTRGTFNATSGVDTLALFNALPARYEDSSTWVANKATFLTIQQQTVGTAGVLLAEMLQKSELLGSPIVKASSVTATTTSGNILAVLGDFRQYIVYDRIGINVEVIQNVVDGDGLPVGKRGVVAYKRVGANVADVNAFRLLKA